MKPIDTTSGKSAMLLLLCGLIFSIASASVVFAACPDDMAAYWKLDEQGATTFTDEIGEPDGNNGVCASDCPEYYSSEQGIDSWAHDFNGIDQGIEVPADATFDWGSGDSFSIELWFRKDTNVASGGEALISRHDVGSQLSWKVALTGNQHATFSLFSSGGDGQTITATRNIANGVWHHIVAIRDGAGKKNLLYIDGQEEAAVSGLTYTSGFSSASAGLTIGWIDTGDEDRYEGLVDEVAIYNSVLTEEEILAHYYLARSYCALFDSAVTIMPLGDSITSGNKQFDGNSYRKTLYNDLVANNFWIDFVGSQNNGNFSDTDHEGWEGYSSQRLADEVVSPALNYDPDVILLHIGTNDLYGTYYPGITGVEDILDAIDTRKPQATVLIARIIKEAATYEDGRTEEFNEDVDDMVADRLAAGDKLIQVDMADDGLFDWRIDTTSPYDSGDMTDQLHPNPSGYDKMADQWYAQLNTFLPMFVSPTITSADSAIANKGQPFEFQVTSDGTKPLTFSLQNQPSGMTIGATSGIIQWTPPDGDDVDVTIRVENDTPTDNTDEQTFTVLVNAPPVAVADQYSVLEGGQLTIEGNAGVLSNDTDEDTDDLTAVLVTDVSHGTLILNANGSFTYHHDGGETTADQFSYQANDGLLDSDVVSVSIAITPINDAPVITGQDPDPLVTPVGTPLTITLDDLVVADPDSAASALSLSVQDGNNYSRVGNTITPAADFNGLLSVPVTVSDQTAQSAVFQLRVLAGTNEVPVITGQARLQTKINTPILIELDDLNVTDGDNTYPDDFSLSVFSGENYALEGHTITPAADFSGTLNVPVSVNDGITDSDRYQLKITVSDGSDSSGGGGGGCFVTMIRP